MKAWWRKLALREKQAVLVGGTCLGIFILYQWLWVPYLDHMKAMRKHIVSTQKLLVWMQATDKKIQYLEGHSKTHSQELPVVALLSIIQKEINNYGLGQYLTQLKQANNESIDMQFQRVEFDKLISLLISLVQQKQIVITQLSITALGAPGIVNAEVELK